MENAVVRITGRAEPSPVALPRDAVLARYRHLRSISRQHHDAILKFLPGSALLDHARRLGIAQGKTLILDSMDQLAYVCDLAIHTAPPGRTRAIDRYARSACFAPASDEALVLEAMRQARFSVVTIERRHESAGLIVRDLYRETEIWLVDKGLEASPDGLPLAMRLYTPDRFSVTAGVILPIERDLLAKVARELPLWGDKPLPEVINERRFAETLYRIAFAEGIMDRVAFRNP